VSFDIQKIRSQFPILEEKINGYPLVYFDNAATTQKPLRVIQRLVDYYSRENCNIHRGVHFLSQEATRAFEETREKVRQFVNAGKKEEIIFTKGTTEAINMVASSFGNKSLQEGDEVLISAMEHHSNLVPWQFACNHRKAHLKIIPINFRGEIIMEEYIKMLGPKTKIVALAHVSNALGTINPVKEMISLAHEKGIPVLIDGAQASAHLKVDVSDLDCDFYCFSGHKMYAPMGAGVLYGKEKLLNFMDPYQGGGEMVDTVTFEETIYNEIPFKFEAGTPNVESILGLGEAIDFLCETGLEEAAHYENKLLDYATGKLNEIEGLEIYGRAEKKSSILSFLLEDIHPYDTGAILDQMGIAVRTGHHCAQPVMDWFNIPGTVRVSLALYNTHEEIDRLVNGLFQVKKMLG